MFGENPVVPKSLDLVRDVTPEDAEKFGVTDKQVVSVKIEPAERTTTFGDVVVRVSPKFSAAMHIDTDESNAAGCAGYVEGEVIVG